MDAVCYHRKRTESTYAAAVLTQKSVGICVAPFDRRYGIDSYGVRIPIAPPVRLLSFRPQFLLAFHFELVPSHKSTIFFAACCPTLLRLLF